MRGYLFFLRGPHCRSARPAIEADSRCTGFNVNSLLVDMSDRHVAKIVDCSIVDKHPIVPAATLITDAAVSKAVIDSAIETNVGAPIACVPYVDPIAPAPITRRPQQAHGRRQHPGARNPIISNRTDPPVARGPYVTGCGNRGLDITGFRAPGCCRRPWACCGRRVIGPGAMGSTYGTRAIGVP